MNIKRLLPAILVGFLFVFASDFIVHGILLRQDYASSAGLWRPEAEMSARFHWMLLGQFLCSATFVTLWAAGFAQRGSLKTACLYGLLMALFSQVNTLILYAVSPLPEALAMKWFFAGLAQGVLLGVISFLIYKPARQI